MRNQKHILLFFFGIIFLSVNSFAQDIEKEIYRYYKTKNLNWANKQNPDDVEILFLNDYTDSKFPNSDILKFKNLAHLIVEARPLVTKVNGEIQDPIKIEINETLLNSFEKLEILQLYKFDFRTFPAEILTLKNLRGLALNNCIIEELPSEISKLKNLEGLYLRQNYLTVLPEEILELSNLQVLDICNNSFIEIPNILLQTTSLQTIYLANYNGVKTEPFTWDWPVNLGVNIVDYNLEIEKLKTLLSISSLTKIHLHVNNASIKKKVKNKIAQKVFNQKNSLAVH